jgi:hypothetical protein
MFTATLSFADSAASATQTVTLSGTGVAVPSVTLSPARVSFSSTNLGSSAAAKLVTLTNTGTVALTLSGLTLGGANASSFAVTNYCTASLAVKASCTVSLVFKPAAAGALAATLSFADNAANSPQSITLSGTGVGVSAVSLSPASLTFPSTYLTYSSSAQILTLKNTGSGTLNLSAITLGGANPSSYSQTSTCGATLAVSVSCTISVIFKPTVAGTVAATLSLANNAAGTLSSVALTGKAVAQLPAVTLSASTLSFPITAVNPSTGFAYSPAQAITLTNSGTVALNLTSITLSGANPGSFTQVSNCPASLAVSSSCTALVQFAPTALGSQSATLVFTDNASSATQPVFLSGTGVSAPAMSLSLSALSYAAVTSGSSSAAQAVTLTNTSATTPLNLTSIAFSGAGAASFTQVNNCGSALAAKASCIILARFTPAAPGAVKARLAVTANNPSATATVTLSATGQ